MAKSLRYTDTGKQKSAGIAFSAALLGSQHCRIQISTLPASVGVSVRRYSLIETSMPADMDMGNPATVRPSWLKLLRLMDCVVRQYRTESMTPCKLRGRPLDMMICKRLSTCDLIFNLAWLQHESIHASHDIARLEKKCNLEKKRAPLTEEKVDGDVHSLVSDHRNWVCLAEAPPPPLQHHLWYHTTAARP